MKPSFFGITSRFAVVLLGLLLCQALSAAPNFTLTPNSVSNTYPGIVTLQVTGLTNSETVLVQKYLDANGNGVVESGDPLVQQFSLTDGQASVFHDGATAVTNSNVPGDTDATAGQITAQLNFPSRDFTQNIIAKYAYVVSSPTAHFTAMTNPFTVTNFPFAQTLTGQVTNLGVGVTNAIVLLFPGPRPGDHGPGKPAAAVIADSAGNYTVKLPTGTYVPMAFQKNIVADYSTSPVLTFATNETKTNNLSVISATHSITGKYADATNSTGLPGVFVPANTDTGLIAVRFTDTNGSFSVGVTSGTWSLGSDSSGLIAHGYLGSQNGTNVDVGASNVSGITVAFPAGTSLFYGQVHDNLGNPLAGIDVLSQDNNSQYGQDSITDTNGNYAVVALADPIDTWQVQVSNGPENPSSYIFSQGAYSQGTNLSTDQAVHQSFIGVLATNLITGHVKDSGNHPISGAGMFASATINGQSFGLGNAKTDNNGDYSITVAPGSWNVSINCSGGNNSLNSLGYSDCPGNQMVNITTSNGVANFTVLTTTATLSGKVIRANGTPVASMNVFAIPTNGGSGFQATTDNNGNFVMGLSGGGYVVQMNTDAATGAPALGLVSPMLPVTIGDGASISNFVLVAQPATGAIMVSVKNTNNNAAIEGINVFANLTFNGTNYNSGSQTTDSSGKTTLIVFNGTWSVGVGNAAAPNQNVLISNNTHSATFFISFVGASPPTISSPARLSPTQVQFTVTGVASKSYTVQACTSLPNWTNLFSTNASSISFPVTDSTATNASRFYRVLTAP